MTTLPSTSSLFARWATAAFLSAALLGANQYLFGNYGAFGREPTDLPIVVTAVGAAAGIIAIALAAFGIAMSAFAIRT